MLKLPICVLLAVTTSTSQAFSFVVNRSLQQSPSTTAFLVPRQQQKCEQRRSRLTAFAESTEESENVEAEITDDEPKSTSEETEEETESEGEEVEEPEEDPEVTALKSEITQLESQLKQKNRDLNSLERMAEEYTKGGYARKVAEMESFRRSKSAASQDSKVAARAVVLEDFLPILENLRELNVKYEGNEFAKSYSALCWNFNNALKDLGVSEFTVKEGDNADGIRIEATREEYSETIAKGMVIQPLEIGYELEGNIMRRASAVVSLGPEPTEPTEEKSEEEAASDEAESED